MIAEKALLGTFLKDNDLIRDTIVKPEHFGEPQHRFLMKSMKKLIEDGQEADAVTLSFHDDPANFGGMSYLNNLTLHANSLKIEEYEELVLAGWKEREKRNILTIAATEDWEIQKVINSLDSINEIRVDDHQSITEQLADMLEAPWNPESEQKGVPTGIKQLDFVTGGWKDGELTYIGARPSMGKTDVMLHLAKQAGWSGCLPIIFSLEMPAKQLTNRLIASTGRYNRSKMRNPYKELTPKQKETWAQTLGALEKTYIQIFDRAGQTVPEMRAKVKKVMNQFPGRKPVILIDYLGLIRSNDFYGGSANLQVTEISRNLKGMAKDFSCPVICLTQLSRGVEQRQDKRPMLSDIRDSGSVEQDADNAIFLYRDKYYNPESDDNTLELIVAKQRNGQVGTIKTIYNLHVGVIEDYNS